VRAQRNPSRSPLLTFPWEAEFNVRGLGLGVAGGILGTFSGCSEGPAARQLVDRSARPLVLFQDDFGYYTCASYTGVQRAFLLAVMVAAEVCN
jgi:hypothetical protein